ncbi:hypothetical protein GGC65_002401 [Sphingopyxis sp. OAS728]|nr:hypothetical protein [Sphingopyxis sp. OAS728]
MATGETVSASKRDDGKDKNLPPIPPSDMVPPGSEPLKPLPVDPDVRNGVPPKPTLQ